MRVLRFGAKGDDVQAFQFFLRGQGAYTGEVDGLFGPLTLAAVKLFQEQHNLRVDGVVGIKTFGQAQALGYNPGFADDDASDTGPAFPPRPTFTALDASARRRLFGDFSYEPAARPDNPEAIRIDPVWLEENILSVEIPQLAGLQGAPQNGKVRLHRLAVAPFLSFFAAVESAGLTDRLLSFGGAFAARFIRGSRTTLSHHAYGTAIDLNVAQNLLGAVPALKGQPGSVRELVPLANAAGLYWGGHFSGRPDGMHFELSQQTDAA